MSERLLQDAPERIRCPIIRRAITAVGLFILSSCSAQEIRAERIDPAHKESLIRHINDANAKAENFWSDVTYGVGESVPPASAIKFSDNDVSWKCDDAVRDQGQELFYCPDSSSRDIVVRPEALAALLKKIGAESFTSEQQKIFIEAVVMHEYGHKLQDHLYPGGVEALVRQVGQLAVEQQADCLVGVGLSAFPLSKEERRGVANFWSALGTIQVNQPGMVRTHGTPEQRERDFFNGLGQGLIAFGTQTPPQITRNNPFRYCGEYITI